MRYPAAYPTMTAARCWPAVGALARSTICSSTCRRPRGSAARSWPARSCQRAGGRARARPRWPRRNLVAGEAPFFLGCGAYRHHVPASVDHLIQRGEFLTSYTPYQPEIAQGTLQALFEFQTQVARLYGCEVANASMYDGSTACWEAIVHGAAHHPPRRRRSSRRPASRIMSRSRKTMARFTGDDARYALPELSAASRTPTGLIDAIDDETSCVVVQYPDISRPDRRSSPSSPQAAQAAGRAADRGGDRAGRARRDQVAGRDGRRHRRRRGPVDRRRAAISAGPMSACSRTREKYVRQMPGRLAGETVDAEGKRGFVLTLSTREQHIRREKATSNICTNSRPVRAGLLDPHDPARRKGSAPAWPRSTIARRVRSGGPAGSGPRGRAGQRQLLQRIHAEAAVGGAAGGPRDGRDEGVLGGVSLGRLYPGVEAARRTDWSSP